MKKHRDSGLIGKTFGELTVLKHDFSEYWICECSCGKQVSVASSKFKRGYTKSCGCLRRSHGFWNTNYSKGTMKFYKMWQSLKARCDNSNLKCYKNYGGRGIKYDPKWKDFLNFKKDMYFKYLFAKKQLKIKDISIERIDVNGNYCFENCTFIDRVEQLQNLRSVKVFIATSPNGEKFLEKNVNKFSKKHGLNSGNIYNCLKGITKSHRGWKFKIR